MKKIKIIDIIFYSPTFGKILDRFDNVEDYTKYYSANVGRVEFLDINEPLKRVFFFLEDFDHMVLERINQKTDKFELETWRPYLGLKKTYSKNVHGVTFRAFPAIRNKSITGTKYDHSSHLENELKRVITRENVILVFSYPSFYITKLLLRLKPINTPIFAIHRGWRVARFKNQDISKFGIFSRIKDRMEIMCLSKYIDYYRCNVKMQVDYLRNIRKLDNIVQFTDGIDFDFYKPADAKDVIEMRKTMGIPQDKKIILFVSRFKQKSGADFLISCYRKMKKSNNNILLFMVGGNKNDECYNFGIESGATMVERVNKNTLLKYYQISDIHVYASRNFVVKNFGGIGEGVIQSLACGVPVISYNLIHFQGSVEEREKVGRLLNSESDMIKDIDYIFSHPEDFSSCRKLAEKYYDKEKNIEKLLEYFDLLAKKYYSN